MANRLTDGLWEWPDHLDLLSRKLADVAGGRCKRLIITLPPQNGKSSLASHWFPVWFLNLFPKRRIVFVSYGAEYAESWGRRVRNSIEEHAEELSVRLAPDNGAAGEWETTEGGGMVSVGVGGSVTGRRADLLIFDDPIKNAEEANSTTQREKVWEFFLSAAYTRLTPDGAIVIIMTRWHEDDLVGRIGAEEAKGGERWERINLPAVAEENDMLRRRIGDPLWPSRWPLASLKRIKKAIGSYFWAALYMQRPAPPEGNYFKRAWFNVVTPDRVPRMLNVTRCWDLAATVAGEKGNADPDYLAGVKIGLAQDGRYYVLHCHTDRTTPDGVERTIKQFAHSDGRNVAIRAEQEGAASGKIVKHYFGRMMDGWDFRFTGIPKSSKQVRSGPFNAACERGDVIIVAGEWNEAFLDQLASFPTGSHDDMVDAAVGAYTDLVGEDEPLTERDFQNAFDGPGQSLDEPEITEDMSFEDRILARLGESTNSLDRGTEI